MCVGHFDTNPCFPVVFMCSSHLFNIGAKSVLESSVISFPYITRIKESINKDNTRKYATIKDIGP